METMATTDTLAAPAVLEVRDLVKHYPGVRAVDGVSFAVRAGECFGLLGPNGAGKTTTIEIMEGIQKATAGQLLFRGAPIGKDFKQRAGVQFQVTALQDFLTVRETLRLFHGLYRHTMDLDELIRLCNLQELLDRDNRRLSGGQRQRLLLAIALVNDPEVIFLDEPTTGLDPHARRNFWALIEGVKRRAKTILMTTHYMEEAYHLCDRIAIMEQGKIIAEGSPQALLKSHFNDTILTLPLEDFPQPADDFAHDAYVVHNTVHIRTGDVHACIQDLLARRVGLGRLEIRARTLDDLFIELTGNDGQE